MGEAKNDGFLVELSAVGIVAVTKVIGEELEVWPADSPDCLIPDQRFPNGESLVVWPHGLPSEVGLVTQELILEVVPRAGSLGITYRAFC